MNLQKGNTDEENAARLSGFLRLAPVLLRAQSQRVVAELIVTAAADLIPELTFSGLLLLTETSSWHSLIAHRDQHLLSSDEAGRLLEALPNWASLETELTTLGLPQSLNDPLNTLLASNLLYWLPARMPTRRYGYLLAGTSLPLSSQNQQYLAALSELAALALDNATRFDDLKEAAHEMSLVNEMAGSLAASLNGEELLNSFMSRLDGVVPVEQANLALFASDSNTYNLPYIWSNPPGHSKRSYIKDLPLSGSPFDDPIQRQEIVAGHWEVDLLSGAETVFDRQYSSQLIIPLVTKKQVVGALAIGTRASGSYQEERLRRSLLEKLAALFALALFNSRLFEEKQLSAEFDSRVGVYNHDYFDRELTVQLHKARRNDYRLGLMMVDLDNLKTVNDQYGHLAGDAALRHVASLITHTVRTTDVVARYGGDEFGVMLPGCTPLGLEVVAEKTRRSIRNTLLVLDSGQEIQLTVSIGAVLCPEDADMPRELIQKADAAMYEAKRYRDQVRIGVEARAPQVSEKDLGLSDVPPPDTVIQGEVSNEEYEQFLDRLGGDRSSVEQQIIQELNDNLLEVRHQLSRQTEHNSQLEQSLWRGLQLIAYLIERREPYLLGGAAKLVRLVRLLAEKLNLGQTELRSLEAAAWLSNLGRILLPETVWNNPEPLSAEEWQQTNQLPLETARMASALETALPPLTLLTLQHQRERFDGTGYPLGLAGEEIPFTARVLGLASALIAMTQARFYRPPLNRAACRQQIEQAGGRQFDANLADILLKLLEEGKLEFLDFG